MNASSVNRCLWAAAMLATAMRSPAAVAAAAAVDPVVGDCLAASNASLRLDNEHRLRAERAELLTCASASCPVDIRNECVRRVDEISAAIPTIIFGAQDADGNDLSSVKVTMDGEVLTDRLQGLAMSIDPGVHTFVFEAPGQSRLRKTFVIRQGQKNRTELVMLDAGGGVLLATPSGRLSSGRSNASTSTPFLDEGRSIGAQKKWAIAVGALGVVGLGAAGAFGWQARVKRDDARALCPGPGSSCPTQAGVDKWSDAKKAGNRATIAAIAGGVGLAGATLLWLTAGVAEPGPTQAAQWPPGSATGSSTGSARRGRQTMDAQVQWADGGLSVALGGSW